MVKRCVFILTIGFPGPLEVHDHRRGPPNEEPPLQADADPEHLLHVQQQALADRHAAAEQAAGALGPPELSAAVNLPGLQHLRAVVQRAICHHRRKGQHSQPLCT